MNRAIAYEHLCIIANGLCKQFMLPQINTYAIWSMYYDTVPQPISVENGFCTVWIDRYYAAYQITGKEPVYVYIALPHIVEELRTERCAKKRGSDWRLPASIRTQFKIAYAIMRSKNTSIWLKESYRAVA